MDQVKLRVQQPRLDFSVCLVIACLLGSAHAGEGPGSLGAARALWSQAVPKSYSYVFREHTTMVTMCVGPGSRLFPRNHLRITVRDGSVVRVASLRAGKLPDSCVRGLGLHTIDGLFSLIERGQEECDDAPQIEARYDARFGFPSDVSERCMLDGPSYTVRDFRVLK
jgi:hypothetical protein